MPERRARYDTEVIGNVICLVELDNANSITSDADRVIEDLHQRFGDLGSYRIIYRDTTGTWDELAVTGDQFRGFKSINERSQAAALAAVSRQGSDEAPHPQDSYRTG
ncbi:hypothetical protein [Methylobacterium planeticum]|uniref:Uncharacterized protein n=1 Tax=Methylobacterium planeticum TaxID=2615211 RepID=A0A6N6MQA6_9HYPH|nr:hypothetical protein [Methylobacterium planeticum]KAB1071585.1 hypothetical protein F6X51_18615 [Methylobacterium planeticum]